MSVHYKFKAALDYSTITFDGIHISVADLKKAILDQKRLAKSADSDLQITNAQTKEVYEREDSLIPKNTSVIVARVPIVGDKKRTNGPVGVTGFPSRYNRSTAPLQTHASQPSAVAKGSDLANMEGTEEEKIAAMMSQSTADYDPSNFVRLRGQGQYGRVPPQYICHKCNNGGHWIKDCPLSKNDSGASDMIRKSTGIPRSFMVVVDGPDVPGALITPEGRYAVPVVDHAAYTEKSKPAEAPVPKPKIPEELLCSLCQDLLTDALLVPCCANSYCDECIRTILVDSDEQECPGCHEKDISPNSLIPNRFLRTAVNAFKNETGYSKPPKIITLDPPPPPHPNNSQDKTTRSRSVSLDELPLDLFPHSPRKTEEGGGGESEEADLYDFNDGPSSANVSSTNVSQSANVSHVTSSHPPPPQSEGSGQQRSEMREIEMKVTEGRGGQMDYNRDRRDRDQRSNYMGDRQRSGGNFRPGGREPPPPGFEDGQNNSPHSQHQQQQQQQPPQGYGGREREYQNNLPPPQFQNQNLPPFPINGPPPPMMNIPPPGAMFPGMGIGPPPPINMMPPMPMQNPNFPPQMHPNYGPPPIGPGGNGPPMYPGGGMTRGNYPDRGYRGSERGGRRRYPSRDDRDRRAMRDEEPLVPGNIEDPLKEFERIMRERDRVKEMTASALSSASSASNAKRESFSPPPQSSSSSALARRSPSSPPPPSSSSSASFLKRSPHPYSSRSPSPKRTKGGSGRRRSSFSRSRSRSPLRRPLRSRSRSRSRNRSLSPTKRRSPPQQRRAPPPYSPSPPRYLPPGGGAPPRKEHYYESRERPRYDSSGRYPPHHLNKPYDRDRPYEKKYDKYGPKKYDSHPPKYDKYESGSKYLDYGSKYDSRYEPLPPPPRRSYVEAPPRDAPDYLPPSNYDPNCLPPGVEPPLAPPDAALLPPDARKTDEKWEEGSKNRGREWEESKNRGREWEESKSRRDAKENDLEESYKRGGREWEESKSRRDGKEHEWEESNKSRGREWEESKSRRDVKEHEWEEPSKRGGREWEESRKSRESKDHEWEEPKKSSSSTKEGGRGEKEGSGGERRDDESGKDKKVKKEKKKHKKKSKDEKKSGRRKKSRGSGSRDGSREVSEEEKEGESGEGEVRVEGLLCDSTVKSPEGRGKEALALNFSIDLDPLKGIIDEKELREEVEIKTLPQVVLPPSKWDKDEEEAGGEEKVVKGLTEESVGDEEGSRISSEVLKKAENAIFQKISAPVIVTVNKVTVSPPRLKHSSGDKTKDKEKERKETSEGSSSKRSVRERLGSKIEEETPSSESSTKPSVRSEVRRTRESSRERHYGSSSSRYESSRRRSRSPRRERGERDRGRRRSRSRTRSKSRHRRSSSRSRDKGQRKRSPSPAKQARKEEKGGDKKEEWKLSDKFKPISDSVSTSHSVFEKDSEDSKKGTLINPPLIPLAIRKQKRINIKLAPTKGGGVEEDEAEAEIEPEVSSSSGDEKKSKKGGKKRESSSESSSSSDEEERRSKKKKKKNKKKKSKKKKSKN